MSRRKIKLTVEYDGSGFSGWQAKALAPGGGPGRSVQDELTSAVRAVTGEDNELRGAGRTDAGVHAEGQVACFTTMCGVPTDRFAFAVTANLPPDITVLHSEEVPPEFDPRKGSKMKLYRYVILNRALRPAIDRSRLTHVSAPLDVETMRSGARHLVGTHDFTSYAAREAALSKNPIRTIARLDVDRNGDRIVLDVEGPAFLMHMVRTIAGSLIEVGRGKHPPEWIAHVLAARDRTVAGPTAPPQGLTLVWVRYG